MGSTGTPTPCPRPRDARPPREIKALHGFLLAMVAVSLAACDRVARIVEEKKKVSEELSAAAKQEAPVEVMEPVVIEMPDPEAEPAFVLDKRSQVSVLLYHDFTTSPSSNPMKIEVEKFREQMQGLKDNGISVISMGDLLRWKRGEINIPDPSVVITMDDGWREVYTLAFPILKEFAYPFTMFLYSKYLNIGGRSLTLDQIREMIEYGAEVGSHGKGHMYLTKRKGLSDEGYAEFVVRELQDPLDVLHANFEKGVLDVISYPYGAYSQDIMDVAKELGYEAGVTVDGKKTSWNTDNMEIGRYIIHGNDDRNYRYGLTFRGDAALAGSSNLLAPANNEEGEKQESLVQTWPEDQETIDDRMPLIRADLSRLEGIDPESVRMTISGLGWVPAVYDAQTGLLAYRIRQRLRHRETAVYVKLRRAGETEDEYVAWKFYLERVPRYIPEALGVTRGPEAGGDEEASAGPAKTTIETAPATASRGGGS